MEESAVDLKSFVRQTLLDIKGGVIEARNEGVEAAPAKVTGGPGGTSRAQELNSTVTQVDFDVAVTATSSSETETGFGIFVAPFGGGAKDQQLSEDETVSRVSFTIVVDLRQ